jgi:hypothetical protein
MQHPQLRIRQVTPPYDQVLPPGAIATVHTLPYQIGRGFANQLRIDHADISRRHACIRLADDYYVVEDLGSRNGVLLNGLRLEANTPRRLHDGDVIQLAKVFDMVFVDPSLTRSDPDLRPLQVRGIWLDADAGVVLIGSSRVTLTDQQFRLLALLYTKAGAVVTRDEIASDLWGTEAELTEQMIDNTVSRLRASLQQYDQVHNYVETVRGRGYRFVQAP